MAAGDTRNPTPEPPLTTPHRGRTAGAAASAPMRGIPLIPPPPRQARRGCRAAWPKAPRPRNPLPIPTALPRPHCLHNWPPPGLRLSCAHPGAAHAITRQHPNRQTGHTRRINFGERPRFDTGTVANGLFMKNTGARKSVYWGLVSVGWLGGVLCAFLGSVMKIPTGAGAKSPQWIQTLAVPIQDTSWWFIPAAAGLTSTCVLTLKFMGKPWMWEFVHEYIDDFRNEVFHSQRGDHHYKHQVTLFRRYPLFHPSFSNILIRLTRPTLQPLLIPVARSGDMNQRTRSTFVVSRSGTDCEGMAGKAFAAHTVQIVSQLPEIKQVSDTHRINEYAQKTGVTPQWVYRRLKSNKPLARSL